MDKASSGWPCWKNFIFHSMVWRPTEKLNYSYLQIMPFHYFHWPSRGVRNLWNQGSRPISHGVVKKLPLWVPAPVCTFLQKWNFQHRWACCIRWWRIQRDTLVYSFAALHFLKTCIVTPGPTVYHCTQDRTHLQSIFGQWYSFSNFGPVHHHIMV